MVVGDDRARLEAAVRDALENVEVVVLSGGLGPTEDDLTRDAVAAALGRQLVFSQEICEWIEERFRRFQRKMAEINKRQAYLVEGAEALPNPRGTAPGQWIELDGRDAMLLPGPPGELKPMFIAECVPRLLRHLPPQVIRTRYYRVAGMGESDLDSLIAPVYTKYANPATTILSGPGRYPSASAGASGDGGRSRGAAGRGGPPIEELLGDRIYSRNGDLLEAVVGAMLRERGATLAVAESCTGGMLAERITSVEGSSDYFLGGFLVYSDRMKTELLGVDAALIEKHTAVSEEVARAMAEGARSRTDATCAIAVTGEAGPTSATGAAPGTVIIGYAGPAGSEARRVHLPGDRKRVRTLAAQTALDFLRRRI